MAKYYWLKLKGDFFTQKYIKKLRRVAGGDTYTIIYLKMMLLSMENDGKLVYDGLEKTFEEELALVLDEEADNVRFTLMFLEQYNLMEELPESEFLLPEACDSIGKEGTSAARMRKHREDRKLKLEEKEAKKKKVEDSKINYAENVKLTEVEYKKLVDKYGQIKTDKMIEKLNIAKDANGRTYKSDYSAILNWVVDWYDEKHPKQLENRYDGIKL